MENGLRFFIEIFAVCSDVDFAAGSGHELAAQIGFQIFH